MTKTKEVKAFGFGKIWNGIFQYRGNYGADFFLDALDIPGCEVEKQETSESYMVSFNGKVVGYYEWA